MPASRAKRAQVADRRAKAIAMALAGMDWDTIADRLSYASRGAAYTDVDRALKQNLSEVKGASDTLREMQAMRYNRLLAATWTQAVKGDLKAVEGAARLVDRIVKLYGLDMPQRTEVTGPGGGPLQFGAEGLAELNALIAIAGQTGPDPTAETAAEGESRASDDGDA